jgi:prepilin-type N-terminal cleavage/methylation domain-containing protein
MNGRQRGVTLVELLVVVAIIGVLVGMLLPAVQATRESARRTTCTNNLRQISLGSANHEAARGRYPIGSESRQWDERPDFQHQFFRWSLLAHLAPFYEQQALLAGLDLSVPLYIDRMFDAIAPQNKPIVKLTVPMFLCPSDRMQAVSDLFGPTNYAGCAGSGAGGGTPFDTDGMFFINSRIRAKDVTDGLSKTVAFSESLLGSGPIAGRTPAGIDAATGYGFVFVTPLTDAACNPFTTTSPTCAASPGPTVSTARPFTTMPVFPIRLRWIAWPP